MIYKQANCSPIIYDNSLAKRCKIDCIQSTYFVLSTYAGYYSETVQARFKPTYGLNMEHNYLPIIELENYPSRLGGLISMWFGFSAFSLITEIIGLEKFKLLVIYLTQRSNNSIMKFSFYFKSTFLISILALLCIHLSMVINQYKNSNMKIVLVQNEKFIMINKINYLKYFYIVRLKLISFGNYVRCKFLGLCRLMKRRLNKNNLVKISMHQEAQRSN